MTSRRSRSTKAAEKSAAKKPAAKPENAPRSSSLRGAHGDILSLAHRVGNSALERLVQSDARDDRGTTLDSQTAARMGSAYGADLGDVRVVDDHESRAAAQSLGAKAFTAGDAVFLGAEAPSRSTPEGQALLAHELAHVAQQQQAPNVRDGAVSTAGDAHEAAADSAAAHAVAGRSASVAAAGAPAGVQRDDIKPSKVKKVGLSRAQARAILARYFARILESQGGKSIKLTESVKADLRGIATRIKDPSTTLNLELFLTSNTAAGSPADFAKRVSDLLPESMDPAALAPLDASEYADSAPAAAADDSTRLGRVVDLVKKTAPDVGADASISGWKFDQMTSDARTNDKPLIGPLKTFTPSVDLERVFNVGKGLPKALGKPAPAVAQPKNYPAVDAVIAKLSPTSLVPKAFQGKPQADEYANAQYLAGALARDLDVAQQKKQFTVPLQLGANYRNVDDKFDILDEVERIVRLIRDTLPHHASNVGQVEIFIGDFRFRVVTLGGGN